MKTFLELCEERFSARKFTDEPVSEDDLNYVMECVRLAPSAVNFQPWKWLIVKSAEAKEKLCKCYDRDWFRTAPLYVVGLKDCNTNWVRKTDGKMHGDVDVSIATEHLCLPPTADWALAGFATMTRSFLLSCFLNPKDGRLW